MGFGGVAGCCANGSLPFVARRLQRGRTRVEPRQIHRPQSRGRGIAVLAGPGAIECGERGGINLPALGRICRHRDRLELTTGSAAAAAITA